jgi:hypothetical protein
MRISTRTHAFLDFATVGFALIFPRLLGASDRFAQAITNLALGKIGYALLTRHELGLLRVIPMKTHLMLDAVAGAGVCALPFLVEEENEAVIACALGLGLFDIAAAPLTDTRSLPSNVGQLLCSGDITRAKSPVPPNEQATGDLGGATVS